MNRLRCFLFAAIVVLSTTTFTLGGEIQQPGKSAPAPSPTPTALTTTSSSDGEPTATQETQLEWQDVTTMLVEILLTIF